MNNFDNFRRKRGIYLLQRWCDLIFFIYCFEFQEKDILVGIERFEKNFMFIEGEVFKKKNFFCCVFLINVVLDVLIVDFSIE